MGYNALAMGGSRHVDAKTLSICVHLRVNYARHPRPWQLKTLTSYARLRRNLKDQFVQANGKFRLFAALDMVRFRTCRNLNLLIRPVPLTVSHIQQLLIVIMVRIGIPRDITFFASYLMR